MKNTTSLVLALILALSPLARGADAAAPVASDVQPQLRGLLVADGERQFSIVTPNRVGPKWVKLGQKFDGWELADFKANEEALILKKDGQTLTLKLAASSVADAKSSGGATKATIADADEVLRKMDFDRMMSRMMEQQKKSMGTMSRQMTQGMGLKGEDGEAVAAFQKKIMDMMVDSMFSESMRGDMARAYSDVFSKEELQGLSDFYSTSAGQAFSEKQPELAQKMQEIMAPRIMAAMPKIQAMQKEFMQEMKTKRAAKAAAQEGGSAPAPAPAPKE